MGFSYRKTYAMVLWMGQKSSRNNFVGGHINEVTLRHGSNVHVNYDI